MNFKDIILGHIDEENKKIEKNETSPQRYTDHQYSVSSV